MEQEDGADLVGNVFSGKQTAMEHGVQDTPEEGKEAGLGRGRSWEAMQSSQVRGQVLTVLGLSLGRTDPGRGLPLDKEFPQQRQFFDFSFLVVRDRGIC